MIRGKKKMIRAMQRNKAGRELQARGGGVDVPGDRSCSFK